MTLTPLQEKRHKAAYAKQWYERGSVKDQLAALLVSDFLAEMKAEFAASASIREAAWQASQPARITEDDVRAIRASAAAGVRHSILAAQYGLSYQYVYKIVKRLRLAHVP